MALNLNRRDFIHAGCTVAAVALADKADARLMRGSFAPTGNFSRVNINVPAGGPIFLNLAKTFYFALPPGSANQTSDGYPANGNLATSINANVGFPTGYYGKFVWKWQGTGSMESVSFPILVYSGGQYIYGIRPSTSGDLAGAAIIAPDTGTAGITNPRIVFNYGWNIQSI